MFIYFLVLRRGPCQILCLTSSGRTFLAEGLLNTTNDCFEEITFGKPILVSTQARKDIFFYLPYNISLNSIN